MLRGIRTLVLSFSAGTRLTGYYYFRIINSSYCIQYGSVYVSSRFVSVPCVRYGYNSLKKILLLCYCVARDTHFSAFIIRLTGIDTLCRLSI